MQVLGLILKRFKLNLTTALFSAVGLVLIALIWIFIYIKLEFDYKLIENNSVSNLQNIVRSFKEHTESSIAISDELLRIIKFNYEKSTKVDFKTLNDYFKNGVLDMKYFNQVGVINKEGLYTYTNMKDQKPIDLSDREHFKIHKEPYTYGIFVSKPTLGRVSKKWSLQLTRRINAADGRFNGVAVVSFDPRYFLSFYKKIDLGQDGFIALMDLDGVVRAIETAKLSSVNGEIKTVALNEQIKSKEVGFLITDEIFDGVRRIYAFERIAGQPLLVLVGMGEADAFGEYEVNKSTYLAFGWALTLLIVLFTGTSVVMITRARSLNETLAKKNLEAEVANREKLEFTNRLTQAEKLAALGQLSAGVAHEINNPIGYVGSNINTMKKYFEQFEKIIKGYQGAEKRLMDNPSTGIAVFTDDLSELKQSVNVDFILEDSQHLIEETQEGITRVKTIIQDLKNFSRSDADKGWDKCDLHQAIRSTLNIVSNEIKYSSDVRLELGDIPLVECIASQINQVILNLVVNAAQAAKPETRGLITIRTYTQLDLEDTTAVQPSTRADAVEPTTPPPSEDPKYVVIEVQDNGVGISAENLSKIFDPFFTTKSVGVGTGLGLSVSHGIIQRHSGQIKIHSELGQGCCFKVILPITQTEGKTLR
jgi:signal transduction histidine kinase